jgi:hypothetical protein
MIDLIANMEELVAGLTVEIVEEIVATDVVEDYPNIDDSVVVVYYK